MASRSYNGFPGWYRSEVAAISRDRRNRDGFLPRRKVCHACGGTHKVGYHNEDYHRPETAIELCDGCHRITHKRFTNWARFVQYRAIVRSGVAYTPTPDFWSTAPGEPVRDTWLDTLTRDERNLYDSALPAEWGHYQSGWVPNPVMFPEAAAEYNRAPVRLACDDETETFV